MFADYQLARLLERTEAEAGAGFVEARAAAHPESGATWVDVAGAYAMFDGPMSPVTQTFGLGLFEPFREADLDAVEEFFHTRGAPPSHEVCPLADPATMPALAARGYRPLEFTSVLFLELAEHRPLPHSEVCVRVAVAGELDLWAETAAEGWRGEAGPGPNDVIQPLMRLGAGRRNAVNFLAELGGRAVAAGSLSVHGDVALLAGASTIPEARRRGAQSALLEARLRYAREAGCGLAMMCTAAGSTSQRNAERNGFRIAYTRIKWYSVYP